MLHFENCAKLGYHIYRLVCYLRPVGRVGFDKLTGPHTELPIIGMVVGHALTRIYKMIYAVGIVPVGKVIVVWVVDDDIHQSVIKDVLKALLVLHELRPCRAVDIELQGYHPLGFLQGYQSPRAVLFPRLVLYGVFQLQGCF